MQSWHDEFAGKGEQLAFPMGVHTGTAPVEVTRDHNLVAVVEVVVANVQSVYKVGEVVFNDGVCNEGEEARCSKCTIGGESPLDVVTRVNVVE